MFLLQGFFEFLLKRRVLSLLILMEMGLAFVIYTNVYFIQNLTDMPILDMELGYSQDRVNTILGAYGTEGFARYRLIMLADLPHPAVYSTLLAALIWAMVSEERVAVLALLPFLAAVFDWAENFVIWLMVSAPLPVDAGLVQVGSVLSLAKHGFLVASGAVFCLLLLRQIYRAIVA